MYVVWKLIADDILEVYMSMMAGMDMGRILLDLSDEVIKRLDDPQGAAQPAASRTFTGGR